MSLAQGARAQTTAFTYQGVLKTNGSPVSGVFDFRATLHSIPTGTAGAPPQTLLVGTNVDSGLFSLPIDVGLSVWAGCSNRWLEIEVRTNGAQKWNPLEP